MPARTRVILPKGLHASVSNLDGEAEAAIRRTKLETPAEGEGPKPSKGRANGAEDVAGYKLPEMAVAAAAVAPDLSGLRDIGEASFGPAPAPAEATAEIVIGVDDRVRINNTGGYPWRVHASLLITARDGSRWIGTGWFIGRRTLMTAGHVVFIHNPALPARHGWVRTIQVMPGRNGNQLPYGSVTSSNFRSVLGWTRDGNENYDYGAILLPTNLGNRTGWFGFGVFSDRDLLASVGNISGYPGDKPAGTQWYAARRIASVAARKVYYDIDTAGGQSGSAVYRIMSGGRYGVAIHAYGGAVNNSGTRITLPVFNNMLAWKA